MHMSTLGKKTVEDIEVKGRNVLVRCDFNVPMKDGVITNDNRIVAALPTIKKLIENGGRVILCSHLGKPKNGPEEKFSLAPVAVRLSELLGKPVVFANDDNVAGGKAKTARARMQGGGGVLLQNTRFRKEETKNLPEFSKDLADLVGTDGAYVNDAFGSAHRAHCSTAGVTDYIKDTAVGYLMEKEIRYLGNAVNDPVRPFVAILGGAKVADKLNVIENLLNKVDTLIIGGGMAYTFLAAKGCEVGKSLVDLEKVDYCKDMLKKAEEKGVSLLLPVDTTVASAFPDPIDAEIAVEVVDSDKIPADMMGLDIGPKTMELFAGAVKSAKTVVWNGPMGVFENPVLAAGTKAVAKALAETDATTVIGGGDSAAAVMQVGDADKMFVLMRSVHHQLAKRLMQLIAYDRDKFFTISGHRYTGSTELIAAQLGYASTGKEKFGLDAYANKRGFYTMLSFLSAEDDFAEIISATLTSTPKEVYDATVTAKTPDTDVDPEVNARYAKEAEQAYKEFTEKQAFVNEYVQKSWHINLKQMQVISVRRINAYIKQH